MFFHNFKYSFKTLFRNKMLIFWTFAFPIIMALFFNMAFSNIANAEKFDIINIAVVNNDDFKNSEAYKTVFEELSDESSENYMFNIQYVTEEEAEELLRNDKIVGYMELENDNPKVTFIKNGTSQTIFKYVVEEISQKTNMINNIVEQEIKNITKDNNLMINQNNIPNENIGININEITKKVYEMSENSDIKLKNSTNKNLNFVEIEFYTLIAMTCLYGGTFGMITVNRNLANMSEQGKRIAVAPIQKFKLVLGSVCAGYIAQLIGLSLLFLFTTLVLKVNYGDNIGLICLLAVIGSLTGLSIGVVLASILKASDNAKTGILIGFTMFGCFLSGMMGVTLKYIIDKNVPFINKLNPAGLITDGFYSLYYYDTLDRYLIDICCLLIFAFILIVISILSLRRQKYDSI